jgi:hypothetical protein
VSQHDRSYSNTTNAKPITPRVIGAGFGRTGTASLKRALEMIGFGPCHHMEEVIKHPSEVTTWESAARGERIDWPAFLQGWGATVDFPSSLYYTELMSAFPDAKIILTVRDAASWYTSMSQTIVPAMTAFPNRIVAHFLPFIGAPARAMKNTWVDREVIRRFSEREHVLRIFSDHIENVKRVVPAHRLLVYKVSDGWGPLCAFLRVPIPDAPFPRVNDTAQFRRSALAMTVVCWIVLVLLLAAAAGLIWWLGAVLV